MAAHDDLTPEQIAQLAAVFRAEAIEHVKGIAEVLFAVEDGSVADMSEGIQRAFREAHSLKGSAATLGFGRVSRLAHRFEDALGAVRDGRCTLDGRRLDALLHALNVLSQTVEANAPGDDAFTDREQAVFDKLTMVFALPEPGEAPVAAPRGGQEAVRQSAPSPEEKKSSGTSPAASDRGSGKGGDGSEQVRVAEAAIDAVIEQFGELFETSLQIESVGHDLRTNVAEAQRLHDALAALLPRLEDTPFEGDAMEVFDMAKNLVLLTDAAEKKFANQHREFQKHLLRSQDGLRRLRIAPVSTLHFTIRNQVREAAAATNKDVALHLSGGEYAVDRAVLNAIEKPLIHIIRNAIDHGIEDARTRRAVGKPPKGNLWVEARHLGDALELSVRDDGRGIDVADIRRALVEHHGMEAAKAAEISDAALFDYLFEPGFTTKKQVSQMSGRGVGLDVVKHTVEHIGGEVVLHSDKGQGTAISLRLPFTMSSIKCLLLQAAQRTFAIPASAVARVVILHSGDVREVAGSKVVMIDDTPVPYVPLHEVVLVDRQHRTEEDENRFAVVVRFGSRRFAFGFYQIFEYTQLVVKPLGDLLERVPNIAGLALLGTGKLCLVLNPADLVRAASGGAAAKPLPVPQKPATKETVVLVVDDSIAIRTTQKTLLESAGFKVLTASDGLHALQVLATDPVDVVLSDVQMPNMDGFELTRAIKSREKTRHIPVVLITSLGSDEDIARGVAAGADAHIVKKDLTRSELIDTIAQLL